MIQVNYVWDGKENNVIYCDSSSGHVPRVGEFVSLTRQDGSNISGEVVDITTTIFQGDRKTSVFICISLIPVEINNV